MQRDETRGLWDFALALYDAPGVAPACLELQEGSGADVPLLLWAAWAGRRGLALDGPAIGAAEARIAPWRAAVIRPLRGIRQAMKSGPPPAPGPASEAVRDKVKAAELAAEKLELDALEAGTRLPPGGGSVALAEANLRQALERARGGPPDAAAEAALAAVAAGLAAAG